MAMAVGPRNPFLADSEYPIAPRPLRPAGQHRRGGAGGPTEVLGPDDVQYAWLGPGHFGGMVSGAVPPGGGSSGATGARPSPSSTPTPSRCSPCCPRATRPVTPWPCSRSRYGPRRAPGPWRRSTTRSTMAATYLVGLDGVYALVDCDNTLFLTRRDCVVAYRETDPTDPASPIEVAARWDKPPEVEGSFVGVNLTFDGRLVLSSDHGWLVCLTRDFADLATLQLPGAAEEPPPSGSACSTPAGAGYGWVRKSLCVGDDGGIYVTSPTTSTKGRVDRRPPLDRRPPTALGGRGTATARGGARAPPVAHGLRSRRGPLRGHRRRRRGRQHHPFWRRHPRRLGAAARGPVAPDRRPQPCRHGRPWPRRHPDRAVVHRQRLRGHDRQQPAADRRGGACPRPPPGPVLLPRPRPGLPTARPAQVRSGTPPPVGSEEAWVCRTVRRRTRCPISGVRPRLHDAARGTGSGRSRAWTGPRASRRSTTCSAARFNTLAPASP